MIRLAFLAALLLSCAPSQHDEARWHTRTVAFAPSTDGVWAFSEAQLVDLRAALRSMDALGPTFVEVPDWTGADVVVRDWDGDGRTCALGAGQHRVGTNVAEINPTCAAGLALRATMVHEVGHVLGLAHVCMEGSELPDCSPVGIGPAAMNPRAAYGDPIDQTRYTGVAQDSPTQLDIDEWNRVHP